jgi:hypothetical protein
MPEYPALGQKTSLSSADIRAVSLRRREVPLYQQSGLVFFIA